MRRSFHSVPLPSAIPSVASVATQTDARFLVGHGFCDERSQSYPWHRSYSVDRTRPPALPVSGGGWNENGEIGTTVFEEITLHRCSKDAKFGLTLWYQTGNDVISSQSGSGDYDDSGTKVYIGEIEPGGTASKDGRARIGDRIIKINGQSVKSRDQVLRLLRSEFSFICLLVSRCSLIGQRDDGFTDDLDALECLSFEDDKELDEEQLECIDEEDGETDDTGTTENDSQRQDSGFGKTDESIRNEESSEQEAIDDSLMSPLADVDRSFHDRHQKSSDSFGSMDWRESDQDTGPAAASTAAASSNYDQLPSTLQCRQFYELLKDRCNADLVLSTSRRPSKADRRQPASICDDYAVLERSRRSDDVGKIGREIAALHLEGGQSSRTHVTARKVPRMGTKIEFGRHKNPACSTEKTSPMEHYRARKPSPHDLVRDQDQARVSKSSVGWPAGECLVFDSFQSFSLAGSDSCALLQQSQLQSVPPVFSEAIASNKLSGHGSHSGISLRKTQTSQMCQTDDEAEYESLVPLDHMLQNTSVQCSCQHCVQPKTRHKLPENSTQLDRPSSGLISRPTDASGDSSRKKSSCSGDPGQNPSKNEPANNKQDTPVEFEWVVKRRADGSRYITRRPVKNRKIKERVHRKEEERFWQTTTDDDDASSVQKLGRYWTKEDRRRHVEQSRIRRREKEAQRAARSGDQRALVEKQTNFKGQSQKKVMNCKGKNVFDDFATLQELLTTPGSEDPGQTHLFNHLLSVTTV